jgi:hypothetical protein
MGVIADEMRYMLSLDAHIVATSFLLIKLEHVCAPPKLAQQSISQLFELAQHFRLFELLLLCYAVR